MAIEPLRLTDEANELDIALDKLRKVVKKLENNVDELGSNLKKLVEENDRLKTALGIVESNPMDELERVLNEK